MLSMHTSVLAALLSDSFLVAPPIPTVLYLKATFSAMSLLVILTQISSTCYLQDMKMFPLSCFDFLPVPGHWRHVYWNAFTSDWLSFRKQVAVIDLIIS
jgi:hypothetical protein